MDLRRKGGVSAGQPSCVVCSSPRASHQHTQQPGIKFPGPQMDTTKAPIFTPPPYIPEDTAAPAPAPAPAPSGGAGGGAGAAGGPSPLDSINFVPGGVELQGSLNVLPGLVSMTLDILRGVSSKADLQSNDALQVTTVLVAVLCRVAGSLTHAHTHRTWSPPAVPARTSSQKLLRPS